MAKKKSEKRNPRLLKKGDVVRMKSGDGIEETVRDVSVVLHMANGMDEVYQAEETVTIVIQDPPVTEEELRQLEEAES